MDLLIAYKWTDMFGGFDRDPATIGGPSEEPR